MSSKQRPRHDAEFNTYNGLANNEEDSAALGKMPEYEREQELHRRHNIVVRERQREQLLSSSQPKRDTQQQQQQRRNTTTDSDKGSDLDISDEEATTTTTTQQQQQQHTEQKRTTSAAAAEGKSRKEMEVLFRTEDHPDTPTSISVVEVKRLSKKLEKSLSLVSSCLLDSICLTPKKVREMQEHPQIASYLHGCIVRIRNAHNTPLPACFNSNRKAPPVLVAARVVSLGQISSQSSSSDLFDLEVSPLSGGSKVRIHISDIVDEPFSDGDAAEVQAFLRDRKETHEFTESFPHVAKRKAQELRDFTFTETDVAEILERKRQKQQTKGPVSYQACYQRRSDVEARVEQLKGRLQTPSLSREERKTINAQLKNLEVELYSLNRQLDTFRSTRLSEKDGGSATSSASASASSSSCQTLHNQMSPLAMKSKPAAVGGAGLFIHGGGGGRGFLQGTDISTTASLFDRTPLIAGGDDGLQQQSITAPVSSSRLSAANGQPPAQSEGPAVTLRILAAVEATARDMDSQAKQGQHPGGAPRRPLGSLMADLPISQQMEVLKEVIGSHKRHWQDSSVSSTTFIRPSVTKFPPLLKKIKLSSD